MPYQVEHLLKEKPEPLSVTPEAPVSEALEKMLENDYSQLPVVVPDETGKPVVKGMIRYKDILEGMRHLGAPLEKLQVLDVMIAKPPFFHLDDDLFDMLNALQDHNAVLITDLQRHLLGILTPWDVMAYFRDRSEDLMRIEDIESIIKDLIMAAYTDEDGRLNEQAMNESIDRITRNRRDKGQPPPPFDRLSFNDYILLLTHTNTWRYVQDILKKEKKHVHRQLNAVRDIRNMLAHFRGEPTDQEREKLKFLSEWLARRVQAWQEKQQEFIPAGEVLYGGIFTGSQQGVRLSETHIEYRAVSPPEIEASEAESSRSRYALLGDWLQNQPDDVERVRLSFEEIEAIIGTPLPPSARQHRAWWANSSVGHNHSQQWLEAGWRTSYINLSEQRVDFIRIKEREEAYIHFFNRLLDSLEKQAGFPLERTNVHGKNWVVVHRLHCKACVEQKAALVFAFAFTRDKRFRAELYIDADDQAISKAIFDRLHARRQEVEQTFPNISWERLEQRRASRVAVYHEGHILDTAGHDELISWAVETMPRFYRVLAPLAEKSIQEMEA